MSSKFLNALRLANKPTIPIGLKSTRKISRNECDQPLLCSSRGRLWRKARSTSASTLRRNGNNCKRSSMFRRKPMSEKTWERNTTNLVAHAHQRKEQKRKRVDEAIARLLRDQQAVNFNAVAKAAGVSKTYLYCQPQLRDRIEALRQQEREQTVREPVARPTGKTDAAKNLVILAKKRRITELEEENRKLKQQLNVALGKAYDRL